MRNKVRVNTAPIREAPYICPVCDMTMWQFHMARHLETKHPEMFQDDASEQETK